MPVEIDKSDRTELKAFFVQNAIPTEANFAALIDASFNQRDDGLAKGANNPLSIEAGASSGAGRRVLNLYETFADEKPAWSIGLRNGGRSGLVVTGGAKDGPKLFLDTATGNIGIGTRDTPDPLTVAGSVSVLTGTNPIRFTSTWSGFPNSRTDGAEISNDTGTYKTLMIVGNRSKNARGPRRVGVWDRLEVNGSLAVTGNTELPTATVSQRLEVTGATQLAKNPILVNEAHTGFSNNATNRSEISNDTGTYKTLMIIGNRSASIRRRGGAIARRVSIWDRLEVNGTLVVTEQEPWTPASLQNGWVNYGSGYGRVSYFKDSLGIVHFRGLVRSGPMGNNPIFTLPAGYRPQARALLNCQCQPTPTGGGFLVYGTNTVGVARVDVLTDGRVLPIAGNNGWISLHGLSFPTY